MKLGDYTFIWVPDRFSIPKEEKFWAAVRTYSSLAFFSWGMDVMGKELSLEWNWMAAEEFYRLQELYADDEQKLWDLEAEDRLFYDFETMANGPFVIGANIVGQLSSAVGLITDVRGDGLQNFLDLSGVVDPFQHGEIIYDDSVPMKSATVTGMEALPDYYVEIIGLDGELFEFQQHDQIYRRNVVMRLLISEEREEPEVGS